TGQTEETVRFKPNSNSSGRPYGWLGAYDVTGDDREEIFVIGDFQDFISVQTWNGSSDLVNFWEHVFDPNLAGKQTIHRPVAYPIRDITGNSQLNIATSVFNETGDNLWHVLIFDAATGSILHDLPNHAIDGSYDVDGNGDYELFIRQTQGSLLPPTATVKILDWNGNGFDTLWSQNDTSFVTQDISDFLPNVNSATSTGKLDLLIGALQPGGQDHFFTRTVLDPATNEARVDIWQLDGLGGVSGTGSASGLNLDALAVRESVDSSASILLSAEVIGDVTLLDADFDGDRNRDGQDFLAWQRGFGITSGASIGDGDANGDSKVDSDDREIWEQNFAQSDPNALQLTTLNGAAVFSQGGSPPRVSVVVGRLGGPGDDPTVIVQGGSETIVAFQPQTDGSVKTAWTRAGLGTYFGATQNHGQHDGSGVFLGDLNGNGDLETLYSTSGEAGQARLVAASSNGSEIWHADFDVPGGKRIWNEPGLVLWRTGNFTTNLYEDVLVQIIRGTGGTGEFHMLDGQTGQTLWTRDYGNTPGSSPIQRGAGEAHMVVYDWDGDGLDEAVNFNPDMFYVVDGDGTNLIDKSIFNGGVFPGGSPLFGAPIVADFLGNQTDTILFAGSYAQFGLVDKNAVPEWNTPFIFDNTPGFIQGIGDVDHDGDLDILSPGHPISPGVDTTSLFHAYDAATGQLLWQVNLPGRAHAPVGGAYHDTPTLSVSADIDNDGRVESVFAIAGTLYAVGANTDGTSGQIEWSFTPDGGFLGSPIIADGDGDGQAEIIVVSTSGMVYGIGTEPLALIAASSATSLALVADDIPTISSDSRIVDAAIVLWMKVDPSLDIQVHKDYHELRQNIDPLFERIEQFIVRQSVLPITAANRYAKQRHISYNHDASHPSEVDESVGLMDLVWTEF
ncbi:MAG: PQQ-binding-like beta-propeller repeat protein, partial [Pirellulales bacterium]